MHYGNIHFIAYSSLSLLETSLDLEYCIVKNVCIWELTLPQTSENHVLVGSPAIRKQATGAQVYGPRCMSIHRAFSVEGTCALL